MRLCFLLCPLVAFFLVGSRVFAGGGQVVHPMHLAQPADAPEVLVAVIEIPAGSDVKYEVDAATGRIVVDRFLAEGMVYPANYGFLPGTSADDGDMLDVLVLTRSPIMPGAMLRVRPIGVLRMVDGGAGDDKVLAVPADDVDASYSLIRDVVDLPADRLEQVTAFFRTYKPAGVVVLGGWGDAAAARAAVAQALASERDAPGH